MDKKKDLYFARMSYKEEDSIINDCIEKMKKGVNETDYIHNNLQELLNVYDKEVTI